METTFKLEVTAEDIAKADSYRTNSVAAHSCPIYQALQRKLGLDLGVYEGFTQRFEYQGRRVYFEHDGTKFIAAYDAKEAVLPSIFTFIMVDQGSA